MTKLTDNIKINQTQPTSMTQVTRTFTASKKPITLKCYRTNVQNINYNEQQHPHREAHDPSQVSYALIDQRAQ
jgi:hypothetical protein